MVPGAGATEIELAKQITTLGEVYTSYTKYAVSVPVAVNLG